MTLIILYLVYSSVSTVVSWLTSEFSTLVKFVIVALAKGLARIRYVLI